MREFLSKINNNFYTKILAITLVCAFILLSFLTIGIKYFISYSFIEKKFSELTNLKIEFINPKSSFSYRFNLNTKADSIIIYDKDKKTKFISIINPDITLKPFGFLFKRAYLKNISSDNIEIFIKRDKKGQIDLIESLNKNISFDKNITLTRLNSNIKNLNLTFYDEYINKSEIKFNFKEINLDILKRKKRYNFSQKGIIETKLNNKKQSAEILISANDSNFDVQLENLNLYLFNDLAKKYISKDIKQLSGNLNLTLKTQNETHNLIAQIIKPTLVLNQAKIISPYKENINITGFLNFDKNKITFNNFNINAKDLSVITSGELSEINSKKPNANITLDIKNTQINNLIPFIPDNAIFYRPKGIPALKSANFFGIANGNLNIKANPLNIDGSLKIQNVHIPNFPKPYKRNDVNARFMRDKVRIYTRVYTPDNEYVLIDGISNLDNSLWGKYSVKSTSKIDLAFAQMYLVPIQQIIGFNIGPVPIMNVSGYGNIDINTQGTLSDAQVFGSFNAYGASASIEGLDAKLTNANCKLVFDNKDLILKEIKGLLDGAKFSLAGKTNIKGDTKLNAKIDSADTFKILKIFNNSIISKPYSKFSKQIKNANGEISADIILEGVIKDFENPNFFNSLLPNGQIIIKDSDLALENGIQINKLSGILDFGKTQKAQFRFNLKDSLFNFEMFSKDSLDKISRNKDFNIETKINSNKISSSDILNVISNAEFLNEIQKKFLKELARVNFYSKLSLESRGMLNLAKINLENFKHNGYLIGLNSSLNDSIKFNSGIIKFIGNKVLFDNLNVKLNSGKIKAKGAIYNILSNEPVGDLVVSLDNIHFENLDKIFPKIKVQNAKINNGQAIFKNNAIKLNSISLNYANTPIFLNANLKDIYKNKILNSDFSTILNEISADNIINPYLISPLKITGELPLKGNFKGTLDNYNINLSMILPKNSDISFSGANLGDINHKREITGRINIANNIAKIQNLKLIKYIANQNNKINPIIALKANGQIIQKNNDFIYDNFKITTNTPINVRILNLIFKKSLLKKGNFDCDIALNGDIKLPKTNGKINFYDLDIPLYNTTLDNIKINISDKFIDGVILAKNKQSDFNIRIHALNKLIAPYIIKDFIVISNKLDIDDVLLNIIPTQSKIDIAPKTELTLKPEDVIVEKGSFEFKDVQHQKINAQNLKGNLSYKDNTINLTNIFFDIAQGGVIANGKYDIKSTKLNLEAKMKDCDSNMLTRDFLNLPNQIFGNIDGSIILSGKNLHTYEGINSIKSDVVFEIENGKMPKLGSLEYLLRAGNLFKNGLLGLSLNNLIEALTPYKTGEFEKISGNLTINNGEIETLNILSKGKNLSLFLDGNYSILENFADIKIYGKLSQNITNALGAIGNASINQLVEVLTQAKRNKNEKDTELEQLLDKIPAIENENNPRFFKARVLGDINKDNYIKNFNWI